MSSYTNKMVQPPRYKIGQPISVVLICRNKTYCLPRVISALARNTRRPDMVILSDDASTDHSPDIFARLCQEHKLEHKTLLHPSLTKRPLFRLNSLRNHAVQACEEGLIVLLDADHEVARTHIEAHLELHLKHQTAILSTGPRLEYAHADGSGPVNFMWGHEPVSMLQASATEPIPSWTGVLVSNVGIVKAAILSIGGFDTSYDGNYGFEDVDFAYRAWQQGYLFTASFEAYVIHIPHAAFYHRNGKINRERFKQKYGSTLTHPTIKELLTRKSWSEFYRELMTKSKDIDNALARSAPLTRAQLIALENIGGKVLLKAFAKRILKRVRHSMQWLISAS